MKYIIISILLLSISGCCPKPQCICKCPECPDWKIVDEPNESGGIGLDELIEEQLY